MASTTHGSPGSGSLSHSETRLGCNFPRWQRAQGFDERTPIVYGIGDPPHGIVSRIHPRLAHPDCHAGAGQPCHSEPRAGVRPARGNGLRARLRARVPDPHRLGDPRRGRAGGRVRSSHSVFSNTLAPPTWHISASTRCAAAASRLLKIAGGVLALSGPRLHRQRHQSEGRALFLRVPAAVRESRRPRQPADAGARPELRPLTVAVFVPLGYFSGRSVPGCAARPGVARWMDRLTGTIFIGLAVRLALARRPV